jgi:hypothetical protein
MGMSKFDRLSLIPAEFLPPEEECELKRLRRLEQRVKQFEEASGVEITRQWTGGKIGAAVRFVMAGGVAHERGRLEDLRNRHEEAIDAIEAALAQSE